MASRIPLVMIVDDHADTREAYVAYLQLPGMSGLAFLDQLKDATATARIPVVLVTGSGELAKPKRAAQLLLKPVLPEALLATVRQLLKLP